MGCLATHDARHLGRGTGPGGQDRRDLDVVVVDPGRRRGLCLEIKWPIEALSLHEVMKVENSEDVKSVSG
ncbi:hypothetical protein KCH_58130 [Kitasatospora cheerisanensis KCTC 2395]|uniref:Uncharacterized protein n=1 Tax=Kitasatospora cheerisanensis KCTC 2395 TaxID=1348663 RepID=A0A066YW35_9ACTN|nr:hypothetical protein KCH_58130 [Kitasatospora cheerisanensis KCTC 2395]